MKFLFRLFVKLTAGLSVWLYFLPKIRHEDPENKRSTFTFKGPAVIVTNHKNSMDFILMELLFFFRYVRCIVGKALYECNAFLTFMLRNLGAIKLDQYSFDMQFFYDSMEVLRNGGLILIFPEGHFSTDNVIKPFQETAALLAVQSGAPVIPIYHSNEYRLFHPVKVVVGKTMDLRSMCGTTNPSSEQLKELSTVLYDKILSLKEIAENERNEKA